MHDLMFLRSQSKLDKLKKLYQASSIQSCFIALLERLLTKLTETILKRRLDTKMLTVITLEVIFFNILKKYPKVQLISKAIFHFSYTPKKTITVSKMGEVNKIQALYHIEYTQMTFFYLFQFHSSISDWKIF